MNLGKRGKVEMVGRIIWKKWKLKSKKRINSVILKKIKRFIRRRGNFINK